MLAREQKPVLFQETSLEQPGGIVLGPDGAKAEQPVLAVQRGIETDDRGIIQLMRGNVGNRQARGGHGHAVQAMRIERRAEDMLRRIIRDRRASRENPGVGGVAALLTDGAGNHPVAETVQQGIALSGFPDLAQFGSSKHGRSGEFEEESASFLKKRSKKLWDLALVPALTTSRP